MTNTPTDTSTEPSTQAAPTDDAASAGAKPKAAAKSKKKAPPKLVQVRIVATSPFARIVRDKIVVTKQPTAVTPAQADALLKSANQYGRVIIERC